MPVAPSGITLSYNLLVVKEELSFPFPHCCSHVHDVSIITCILILVGSNCWCILYTIYDFVWSRWVIFFVLSLGNGTSLVELLGVYISSPLLCVVCKSSSFEVCLSSSETWGAHELLRVSGCFSWFHLEMANYYMGFQLHLLLCIIIFSWHDMSRSVMM